MKVIKNLNEILANTYILYTKTQNYHWNVTGAHFYSLHALFEDHYKELANAVDTIAERIRILNHTPPSTLEEFLRLKTLTEGEYNLSANEMLQDLVASHEKLLEGLYEAKKAAGENDPGTEDLMVQRIGAHEKMLWMLRAHL